MTKYAEDLAKMLRAVRLACGLSQENVVQALGMSRSTYSYYESGRMLPSAPELVALGKVFAIPAACFLYPERWAGMDHAWACPDYIPRLDPSHLGELTSAEKDLVARSRAQAPAEGGE